MKIVSYALCISLLILATYLGCNEFVKKTPKKARQEKAQRETFTEQCGVLLDAFMDASSTLHASCAHTTAKVYAVLRSVACGQTCCVDTADVETLKKIVQQAEKTLKVLKESREELDALTALLS